MKIATSELEHLREEVKNCHRIIKNLQKKREFVGLTESDRRLINFQWQDGNGTATEIIDLVEAKLREKNT